MENTKLSNGRKRQKGRNSKYDIAFKRKIAREYIEGNLSTTQLAEIYNVRFQYVSTWVKQFSSELAEEPIVIPMTEQEQQDFELLKKQNDALKKKLEHEQMKNFALETMVDLAKSELGIDLRKKLVPNSRKSKTILPADRHQFNLRAVWQDKTSLVCTAMVSRRRYPPRYCCTQKRTRNKRTNAPHRHP